MSELLTDLTEEALWDTLCALQNKTFRTAKGLEYTYTIKGNEMFVDRKEKSITRSSVNIAFKRTLELNRIVTGPKKLGVFGASYLYPIFLEIGLIQNSNLIR